MDSMQLKDSLPVIASFWYGSDLSWLEAVCIKSYLDRGHQFVLYTAGTLTGIPEGTDFQKFYGQRHLTSPITID